MLKQVKFHIVHIIGRTWRKWKVKRITLTYLNEGLVINKQEPIHHKVGSKPHPTPRGFLNKVGPTESNSRRIAQRWFYYVLFLFWKEWYGDTKVIGTCLEKFVVGNVLDWSLNKDTSNSLQRDMPRATLKHVSNSDHIVVNYT
jgi:hypothetical protein